MGLFRMPCFRTGLAHCTGPKRVKRGMMRGSPMEEEKRRRRVDCRPAGTPDWNPSKCPHPHDTRGGSAFPPRVVNERGLQGRPDPEASETNRNEIAESFFDGAADWHLLWPEGGYPSLLRYNVLNGRRAPGTSQHQKQAPAVQVQHILDTVDAFDPI